MTLPVEKSIELANGPGYLDRLQEIYPVSPGGLRFIDKETKDEIEQAFKDGSEIVLVKTLLKQSLFPVKDPYVAFLRKSRSAVVNNPQTVIRIAKRVKKLGLRKILESISAEKEANRQIGPQFKT